MFEAAGDGIFDFSVHLPGGFFTILLAAGQLFAQEYGSLLLLKVGQTDHLAHPPGGDHLAGHSAGHLQIVFRPAGFGIPDGVFRRPAAEEDGDPLFHLLLLVEVLLLFRELLSYTHRLAAGNNRDLVDGVGMGQGSGYEGVTGFVVSYHFALPVVHLYPGANESHQNSVARLFNVHHFDCIAVLTRGDLGAHIQQIFQVGTAEAGYALGNTAHIHRFAEGFLLGVDIEDCQPVFQGGEIDGNFPVKTSGALQCGVQDIRTVGGGDHDGAGVLFKAVQLREELVEGLFPLVVSAAEAGAAVAADGIQFVDKDNTGSGVTGVFEHIADARSTDTDKHLHEVGTAGAVEGDAGFTGNSSGYQSLSGTGSADKKNAPARAGAEFVVFFRVLEEVDDVYDLLFCRIEAGDIAESGVDV